MDKERVVTLDEGDRSSDASLTKDVLPEGTLDPVYEAKAHTLNNAVQEIGMGRYQWGLVFVIGFGWLSDNLWPIATSLILSPVSVEFNPAKPEYLSLSQNIGLLIGAVMWGFGCDVFGRRIAFNCTIGVTSVFALIAAGSPNFAAIAVFDALWSIGVGGNLPVDSAILIEFLPASHQWIMTFMTIWWSIGQLFITLIAWPLLGNISCPVDAKQCGKRENFGWRYLLIVAGSIAVLMFLLRFAFPLWESPKYLVGRGRDAEAVQVVHKLAKFNRKPCSLALENIQPPGDHHDRHAGTAKQAALGQLEKFKFSHIRALFSTKQLAYTSTILTTFWAVVGLAFPLYNNFLPYLLALRGANFGESSTYITYRNSAIIACLGVPGAVVGAFCVELPRFGRRGTLASSTVLTGIFLFCSTTANTSNALLGWNCAYNFCSNIMYGVLYAFTPEILPTKDRGTGNALFAMANRIFGIIAPLIAMFGDLSTAVPVYVSGALFIFAGFIVCLIPFESRGKASM